MTPSAGSPHQGSFDARSQLKNAGLRVTTPRRLVLETLAQQPHTTVAELATAARERLRFLSTQTIYDVLAIGVSTGLVRRFNTGQAARYELEETGRQHHHVACRRCGRVVPTTDDAVLLSCVNQLAQAGYPIDEMVFRHVCGDCVSKSR